MRKLSIFGVVFITILVAACESAPAPQNAGSGPAVASVSPSPTTTPPGPPAPPRVEDETGAQDEFVGTAGTTDKPKGTENAALLKAVRFGEHSGFDRTVFEFADVIPGYHIEYVDKPVYQCGSGEAVPVEGSGWLLVRFDRTNAHTEQGKPTIDNREVRTGLSILKEAEMICDFEADVQWVLGVSSPNKYRVLELKDPARIAVDIKH
jgi:hypothetical protein